MASWTNVLGFVEYKSQMSPGGGVSPMLPSVVPNVASSAVVSSA